MLSFSKYDKTFLQCFSTTSRHGVLSKPIIIALKQNNEKSPKRGIQGKLNSGKTKLGYSVELI